MQPLRILHVDDNHVMRRVIRELLALDGHSVTDAADGHEAWEILSADIGRFDVIITDNEMPRMSGLALVQRARANGFCRPIILHSAGLFSSEVHSYQEFNVTMFVAKGTGAEKFLQALNRAADVVHKG